MTDSQVTSCTLTSRISCMEGRVHCIAVPRWTHSVQDFKELVDPFLWQVLIFRQLNHVTHHLVEGVRHFQHLFPSDVAVMVVVKELE